MASDKPEGPDSQHHYQLPAAAEQRHHEPHRSSSVPHRDEVYGTQIKIFNSRRMSTSTANPYHRGEEAYYDWEHHRLAAKIEVQRGRVVQAHKDLAQQEALLDRAKADLKSLEMELQDNEYLWEHATRHQRWVSPRAERVHFPRGEYPLPSHRSRQVDRHHDRYSHTRRSRSPRRESFVSPPRSRSIPPRMSRHAMPPPHVSALGRRGPSSPFQHSLPEKPRLRPSEIPRQWIGLYNGKPVPPGVCFSHNGRHGGNGGHCAVGKMCPFSHDLTPEQVEFAKANNPKWLKDVQANRAAADDRTMLYKLERKISH